MIQHVVNIHLKKTISMLTFYLIITCFFHSSSTSHQQPASLSALTVEEEHRLIPGLKFGPEWGLNSQQREATDQNQKP